MGIRLLFTAIILLLVNSGGIFGQVTEKDKADAVKRAKQFAQILRQTQDLKPLFSEFFTKDFLQSISRDSGHNMLFWLEISNRQQIKLTIEQRQRFYFAVHNWSYLVWLYNCWRNPDNQDAEFADRPIPPGVKKILEETPLLRYFLKDSEIDSANEEEIEKILPMTVRDVETLTRKIERMNYRYRRSLKPIRHISDKQFDWIVNKCVDSTAGFYRVEMASCNNSGNCPGVPKGVNLIGVSIPLFEYVDFARLNGKMKIVRLFVWDESMK